MSDTEPGPVERLIHSTDLLTAEVAALASKDRRRRLQVVVLTASVALDLLLSAGFFFALDRTNDAQGRTDRLVEQVAEANARTEVVIKQLATVEETARLTCEQGNRDDANERQFWEGLIALPSDRPPDPDGLARFRALLADTYSPEDCG